MLRVTYTRLHPLAMMHSGGMRLHTGRIQYIVYFSIYVKRCPPVANKNVIHLACLVMYTNICLRKFTSIYVTVLPYNYLSCILIYLVHLLLQQILDHIYMYTKRSVSCHV